MKGSISCWQSRHCLNQRVRPKIRQRVMQRTAEATGSFVLASKAFLPVSLSATVARESLSVVALFALPRSSRAVFSDCCLLLLSSRTDTLTPFTLSPFAFAALRHLALAEAVLNFTTALTPLLSVISALFTFACSILTRTNRHTPVLQTCRTHTSSP